MGFFDFLKPEKLRTTADQPDPDYIVAHMALRKWAQSDPLGFISRITSTDGQQQLADVIDSVGQQLGIRSSYTANDLQFHFRKISRFPCVAVAFPEPRELAQVHFVGLVAMASLESGAGLESSHIESRYFTLEKSITLTNEPRTVLGEWRHEQHQNYGGGPPPEIDAFLATIEQYVK